MSTPPFSLGYNAIGDAGAAAFARVLANCHSLRRLESVMVAGALAILKKLRPRAPADSTGMCMVESRLEHAVIGRDGLQALADAVPHCYALESLESVASLACSRLSPGIT